MNKTRIEWTDYTFNPVTGCWGPGGTAEKPKRCGYCYAKRMAGRFIPGDFYEGYDPFEPVFHPERLSQPAKVKKPSKIFVCSMADLFGDWVDEDWIEAILRTVLDCPQHTFQFLTKNPKRLKNFNPWPKNCWVGTTVTNQADADERLPWLLQVDAPVLFVSHEPLLGPINLSCPHCDGHGRTFGDNYGVTTCNYCGGGNIGEDGLSWAIIGAQTGPGPVKPEVDWVMNLAQQYTDAGVPLFLKDNLGFKDQPQEFPVA